MFTRERVMKVTDFGLAINSTTERPVTRLGTLDYMAPEVGPSMGRDAESGRRVVGWVGAGGARLRLLGALEYVAPEVGAVLGRMVTGRTGSGIWNRVTEPGRCGRRGCFWTHWTTWGAALDFGAYRATVGLGTTASRAGAGKCSTGAPDCMASGWACAGRGPGGGLAWGFGILSGSGRERAASGARRIAASCGDIADSGCFERARGVPHDASPA